MKTKTSKAITIVVNILLTATLLFSQEWSEPIFISGGDAPDIDVDPITGNVYVLTMKNGVTLTKVSPIGIILEQEIVPGAEYDEGGGQFGASVAVDMNGYPHVCYRYYEGSDPDGAPTYSAFYVKKTATGWQQKIRLSQNLRRGYVVRIDVDRNNVAHIVQGFIFDEEGSIHGRIKYFRVKNNSIDKQEELGTAAPYIYRGDDRIEITTRPERSVYIVSGVPDPNGKVYYLFSTDGGDNFTNWGDIHSSECFGRNGSPDMAVDSTDYIHICYGASEDDTRNDLPSVRYVRFYHDSKVVDKPATPEGYLVDWKIGMGLGSIACTDDGQTIIIAFSEQPGGKLYTTLSFDMGTTWERPFEIVSASGSDEGRNKHFIRSKGNNFYLVYPHNYNVFLRTLTIVTNEPPVADAGGPYTASEGSSIAFNGSNSSDPDGAIIKYEWDWQNDGIYDITSTVPTYDHSYADDFIGQVKLRVTDDGGRTSTDLSNVTVINANPIANAGGPYSGLPGEIIQCHGSATDPGTEDILTYTWDLNFDGIFEMIGQNVSVQFSKGGIYQIILRVSDDDGGFGLDTTSVQIVSEPPVVSQIQAQTVAEGTPFDKIKLDDFVTDPDNDDAEITWQVHGNTNLNVDINANRLATITPADENWYGAETLIFVATDPSQLSDSTATTFTITNVNDPPIILPIGEQTTDEGNNFDPIHLDNHVSDSDNTVAEISWSVRDNVNLDYKITNRVLTVHPRDADWSGSEQLTIVATDPGGLSDTAKVIFTVNPVNDPPEISAIPGQQQFVGDDFAPINLDDFVSDVDNRDEEISWSYKGNTNLIVAITNRVATITRADVNWIGSATITFIAADPWGASDSTDAVFESKARNKPPVVIPIPDQQILEGQYFQPIYLDGYVTDPDHDDSQITWHISGFVNLIVTNANRVVTISTSGENWNGMEIIKFKAVDPTGLSDSSLTVFKVFAVNDPPELSSLPDFEILEDDTLIWTFSYLRSLVIDPDNDSTDFQFQITDHVNLSWRTNMQKGQIYTFGPANWYGEETITVTVFDGAGGSDSQPCKIMVKSVPDTPLPFSIIYPLGQVFSTADDTIYFSWHRAIDPESGKPMYQLNVADDESFHHVIDQYNNLLDTSFAYLPKTSLQDGSYYWKILAFNSVGFTASDVGSFRISSTGISDNMPVIIPTDYVLFQNYPNPFNPETWIVYQLPEKSHITLEIFNSLGQRVAVLEDGFKAVGTHKIKWNVMDISGKKLPSGIYICRLQAGGKYFDRKMVLLQ